MAHFFTSDTHLGHANIIKYCKRPFMTDEEMQMFVAEDGQFKPCKETVTKHDEHILAAINAVVKHNDTLWIVGDFCWGEGSKAEYYTDKIMCMDIRLVRGNHDHPSVEDYFTEVHDIANLVIDNQPIVMCHYPMRSWNRSHHGSFHLFGHVHGNLEDIPHHLALDVGVDTHDYKPWSWDQIKEYMAPRADAWKQERVTWRDKNLGGMAPGTHR
jgi:calcineurin-like phosphoesterase family protein